MRVRKMLLREETEKVLHTKSNGDKLVVASSGDGYTAFTKDNVRIGHISAETDAAAIAEFSKKEPKYESMNKENKQLQESASFDELTDFFNWIQDYKDGALYDEFSAEFESVEDRDLDMDSILTWLESFDEEAYYDYIDKHESMNEDYLDSAEFRIQIYEDDIPELFRRVHDGYMKGMVNAKAYADVLAKIYSVLEELDYVDESLKEGYMDAHDGMNHVDTLDMMAALKAVVREYGHMELVTPIRCEMRNDDHGRRLALVPTTNEGLIPDKIVPDKIVPDKIGGDINLNLDASHSSVGVLGGQAGAGGTLHNKTNDDMTNEDIHDDVMPQHCADDYDDDFDDLSAFNDCSEVRKADTLYGVEGREDLVEAVYTDTNGIMGVAGETYTTAELRKIWNDNHNDDPSMVKYNGDYDKWVSDTLAQMSRNNDVDEGFDMNYGPDLSKLSWQVASYLDVDALGEDKWIEFICDDPRDATGGKKSMRFEAIGEDTHMYGFIRTNGDAVDVQFRNGSESTCYSAEEVARFIAGEFGISL